MAKIFSGLLKQSKGEKYCPEENRSEKCEPFEGFVQNLSF